MGLGDRVRRRLDRERLARMSEDALRSRLAARRGIVFLCYHAIGDDLPGYAWRTAPDAFARQMTTLKEIFDVLPLETAMARLATGDPGARPAVVITFDDGFRDNLTTATPILEDANLPATLFVPRDLIHRGGATHMTEDDLAGLARHPLWSLGAHGITHNVLPGFRPEDQHRELAESRDWLEGLTGTRPRAFAYPQGAICQSSVAQARDCYDWAFSTDRRLGAGYDAHQIRRFCPTTAEDNPLTFLRALIAAPVEDGRG